MCRWLAYSGAPLRVEELLYRPKHSLIDQSMNAKLSRHTTNGDGFGLGWYDDAGRAAIFHSTDPAWNDHNLRELADHLSTPLLFAHVRASTWAPVQQTNCHPFRYGNWLWMHNGSIADWGRVKRELQFAVDPELFPFIEGSTDSETFFYLALTHGLEDDPPGAVARAVAVIESVTTIQMAVAVTDGVSIWAYRYATAERGEPVSLFFSADIDSLRELYPDTLLFRRLDEEARLIVSEPLSDLPGAWHEVPPGSWGVVQPGADELHPFAAAS